jgi:hypothetical protein
MSPTNTSEKALEAYIERFLSGGVTGASPNAGASDEDPGSYGGKGLGYVRGLSKDYNPEYALDTAKLWEFLEATQGEELAELHYKPDWKQQIIERLHRKLKKDSILAILKRGLDVDNAHLDFLYRLPYNELKFAEGQPIELIDGPRLIQRIQAYKAHAPCMQEKVAAPLAHVAAQPAQPVNEAPESESRWAAPSQQTSQAPPNSPTAPCPNCGSELVERTAKRGPNAGNTFFGCSSYPKCRYTA